MILKLVVVVLVGMVLGIIGSVMLDRKVGQWLQRRLIEPQPQSFQNRLLATLLRHSVILIIVVALIGVMAKAPILVNRQFAFGVVIGMGFSFFFLVGSFLRDTEDELRPGQLSSEVNESGDTPVTQ